jgi:hypothetical protein
MSQVEKLAGRSFSIVQWTNTGVARRTVAG